MLNFQHAVCVDPQNKTASTVSAPSHRATSTVGDALHNERPLTIVMAPAGSGKTTSAIEWLEAQKTPVAWLSLDADDNDPVRFLRALVEALQLAGVQLTLPSGQRGSRPLLTAIINQLQKHETVALILDDYHVITDTTIHEIVSYLLDHMPVSLRLVLLSREEPPLPCRVYAHADNCTRSTCRTCVSPSTRHGPF